MDFQLAEAIELGFEDRVGLEVGEREPRDQLRRSVSLAVAGADDRDRLVQVVENDREAFEDMDSREQEVEFVLQPPSHDIEPEFEEVLQDTLQIQPGGNGHLGPLGGEQTRHVDVEIRLKRRVLKEIRHRGVKVGTGPEFENDPNVVGAEILDVGELGNLTLADQFADPRDQRIFLDAERNRGDDRVVRLIGIGDIRSSNPDRPLARGVDLPDFLLGIENHSTGRKVGAEDVFDELFERSLAVVEQNHERRADFLEIVRRDIRGHADGDPRNAVDQQVGKLRGEDGRFVAGRGEVRTKLDGPFANLAEKFTGDRRETALGVPKRSGRVAVDRAEVSVTLDQRLT